MYKYLLTIAACSLLVLGACKKKDGDGNNNKPDVSGKTKRQIFMMQNWRWADWQDSAENDIKWTNNMETCNTDDIYTFKTGNKVSVSEGANDCLPGDPDQYDMTWTMASDNATDVIIGVDAWEIKKMANEEIILWRVLHTSSEEHFQKMIFKRN